MTTPEHKASPEDEAADWFARLRSDSATEGDWTAFQAWLSAGPANQAAFAALEGLWVDLDLAAEAGPIATKPAAVLPFVRRARRAPWGVWTALSGVAAMLVLAVVIPSFTRLGPSQAYTRVVTAKNERKSIILPDGTRMDLNAGTTILYHLARNDRSIVLVGGEAVFSVVHDPGRPFSVLATDRRITDVGTVFDVTRLKDTVQVTVDQGEVSVEPAAKSSEPPTDVRAGFQLLHQEGQAQSSVKRVDVDAVLSWRSGRLIYKDASLEAVVSDLNRYFSRPIRIRGQKAAGLRFSGVLVLDSEDAVIGRLQSFLPVSVNEAPDGVWISAR